MSIYSVFRSAVVREIEMFKRDRRARLIRYVDLLGPWVAIVIFTIVMGILRPSFLLPANVTSVLVSASSYIVLAVGMTFVMTAAGIDISVGSIVCLSGLSMVLLVKDAGMNPIPAMAVCLALGCLLGLVNGLLITKLRLPDFIATIATMVAYRGIALVSIGGKVLFGFPPLMVYLGQAKLLGIVPVSIVSAIVVVLVADFLYKRTRFGRYAVAIGGNRLAAIHAGIPADRYKIYTYIFSGFLAALAAINIIGRLDSFHGTFGQGIEFHVITVVIIGGTSLYGGSGRIWGSLGGAILISMVNNGLVVLGLPYFWQNIAVGTLVIAAVALYTMTGRRQSRGVGGMGG